MSTLRPFGWSCSMLMGTPLRSPSASFCKETNEFYLNCTNILLAAEYFLFVCNLSSPLTLLSDKSPGYCWLVWLIKHFTQTFSKHQRWHGCCFSLPPTEVFHTTIMPVLSAENILFPDGNRRHERIFKGKSVWKISAYTVKEAGQACQHTETQRSKTKYLQSQNKRCWWNCCDPQTPAGAGRSHRRHQAATLAPESRSPQSPPGSAPQGGTGRSTRRMDEGAPSGLFPEASQHSTLWRRAKTKLLKCIEPCNQSW